MTEGEFPEMKFKNFKEKNNNNFKHGKALIKSYCIDCGKEVSDYKIKRCRNCSGKFRFGKNNPMYIDGRKTNNRCIDCNKKLDEYRSKRCRKCQGVYHSKYDKIAESIGRGKGDYYKGVWMRSSWERKYAKWLDKNRIQWKHEFKRLDLGNTRYTTDFYLHDTNKYIEIKGYY